MKDPRTKKNNHIQCTHCVLGQSIYETKTGYFSKTSSSKSYYVC